MSYTARADLVGYYNAVTIFVSDVNRNHALETCHKMLDAAEATSYDYYVSQPPAIVPTPKPC